MKILPVLLISILFIEHSFAVDLADPVEPGMPSDPSVPGMDNPKEPAGPGDGAPPGTPTGGGPAVGPPMNSPEMAMEEDPGGDPGALGGDPGDRDPGDLDPGDRDPGDLDPGDRDPGDLDPGDRDPGDRDPGDQDPGELDHGNPSGDPGSPGGDPGSVGGNTRSASGDHGSVGGDPRTAGGPPGSAGGDSRSAGGDPRSAGGPPGSAGGPPGSAVGPSGSAGAPSGSAGGYSRSAGGDPGSAGGDPGSAGGDPGSAGADPRYAGGDPGYPGGAPRIPGFPRPQPLGSPGFGGYRPLPIPPSGFTGVPVIPFPLSNPSAGSPSSYAAQGGVPSAQAPEGPKIAFASTIAQFPDPKVLPEDACPSHLPAAVNELSFSLSNTLTQEHRNLLFSPLSVSDLLALLFVGAGGDTLKQIRKVAFYDRYQLAFPNRDTEYVSLNFTYVTRILSKKNNSDFELSMASRILHDKNVDLKKSYVAQVEAWYKASTQSVDFANDGQKAMSDVNGWVAEKTDQKIPQLLAFAPNPQTKMMLLSAVYFKGKWKKPFSKDKSKPQDFYLLGGATKTVTMMTHSKGYFNYLDSERTGYQFLELPYKGDAIAMLIALPKDQNAVGHIVMDPEILCHVKRDMKSTKLSEVAIPKFKIEFEVTQLKEKLQSLGLTDLFDRAKANLTGMSSMPKLFVDAVIHKSVIEVDEEGTVATSASAATVMMGDSLYYAPMPSFVADHPFLMYIVDKRFGMILFSGQVVDPS